MNAIDDELLAVAEELEFFARSAVSRDEVEAILAKGVVVRKGIARLGRLPNRAMMAPRWPKRSRAKSSTAFAASGSRMSMSSVGVSRVKTPVFRAAGCARLQKAISSRVVSCRFCHALWIGTLPLREGQ